MTNVRATHTYQGNMQPLSPNQDQASRVSYPVSSSIQSH